MPEPIVEPVTTDPLAVPIGPVDVRPPEEPDEGPIDFEPVKLAVPSPDRADE